MITCLQNGATKRSAVYIAAKWLKDLERDYCKDLIKDTNDTLDWLENLNEKAKKHEKHFKPFMFDVEALYDSLSPKLVLVAIGEAMNECRPTWSKNLKNGY